MADAEPTDDGVGLALRQAVTTYCTEWRNPSLPPLQIHRHTFTSWYQKHEASVAGCYAAYHADGGLLYLGKASLKAKIGQRLWQHFERAKPEWAPLVAHLFFVEVVEPFEAPSLEEYLIRELQPRHNALGNKRIGTTPTVL